jgi:glycogen debranching enzyme
VLSNLLVIKSGATFACFEPAGDMSPEVAGSGLYMNDTRYLSRFELTVGGRIPKLESATTTGAEARITQSAGGGALGIRRLRIATASMQERAEVTNEGDDEASTSIQLTIAADLADWFAIRGFVTTGASSVSEPVVEDSSVRFAHTGLDGVTRSVRASWRPAADSIEIAGDRAVIRWWIDVGPGDTATIDLTVDPDEGHEPATPEAGAGDRGAPIEDQRRRHARSLAEWMASCTEVVTDNADFDRLVSASMRDIHLLLIPVGPDTVVAAGVPWYVALFGRDSLITAHQLLMMNSEIARATLRALARHQSIADDAERDAEPGKILHELRRGELARAGIVPFSPYYGSVDSTPLFVLLASDYYAWTGDLDTVTELRPSLEGALAWIDEHGDVDGDGFVEYRLRSSRGLSNQGWKDHDGSVVHADGSRAAPPIAIVEVQGYVYAAKAGIARVFEALGDDIMARDLRAQAAELKARFNQTFWIDEEGTYAFALDGDKNQVRSVASNAGHALWCGIADDDKARLVAGRLLAPDMFSGWGVRTLSEHSPAYDPMSYHNGSVWPHDNAIIAAGMARYGLSDHAAPIVDALYEAALDAELRLPELFGGQARSGPSFARYPIACSPQAWAAGVFLMLLSATLGVVPDAARRRLRIRNPSLPSFLRRVELHGLRVGGEPTDIAFESSDRGTSYETSAAGLEIVD